MKKKTVVVVEDDLQLQHELVSMLNLAPDITCLYAVSSGEEALLKIPKNMPDVVLMDIRLPGLSGIDCVKILRKNNPNLEIVILTIYQDPENIFQALKAGAGGYLIKTTDPSALHDAVRDVASGGAPFTAHIARMVVRHFRQGENQLTTGRPLTSREEEVLKLLAAGYRYKEVATQLTITAETVKSHIKNICSKLHVHNRIAAIAKYCASNPTLKPTGR